MSTFASSRKSKSNLLIDISHISGSPHKGDISALFVKLIICGKEFRSFDVRNLLPATCDSVANPIRIKS